MLKSYMLMCAFLGDYTDVFTCDEGPLFYFFFVFKANMALYPVCVQYERESVRARMWVGRVSMGLSRSQNVEQRLPEEKRSEKTSYRSNGEHSLAPLWHMNKHTHNHTHVKSHINIRRHSHPEREPQNLILQATSFQGPIKATSLRHYSHWRSILKRL